MIKLDTNTRAGRMLEAGRLTLTFRSVDTGQHITVTAKCRKPRDNGQGWESCRESEAKVIFLQVPNAGGGWDDRIGKITVSKGIVFDGKTDQARRFCAQMLLRYAAGEPMPSKLEVFESDNCGRCGRQLTDPVSIERGIGPECYGMMTGSQHQEKHTEREREETRPPQYAGLPLPSPRDADFNERWAAYKNAASRESDRRDQEAEEAKMAAETNRLDNLKRDLAFAEKKRDRSRGYVNGGRMSRRSKAQALVDSGLADDLADARAQLEDMGEL